ncbi:MAG TPA: SHOCT domain-containing protein [Mycobacterium sp.]|uniref:SHOCT domain-containing protein n=1 Tax=Mycobacterium sp. TaxID=1785 RepID=UPI002CD36E36|nr:SHOCT domain-containing protein [Mycobacterium sp.]HME78421.1 SHOCT domain-containing protein [Mycobacterium sp.]
MTTGPAASRLQENSLLGLGGGLVAIVAAGYVCTWAGFSQSTTTSVMGLAIGVPAAVELRMKSRRRNTDVDIARIQRGELRRPVGLVVMLLAAGIVLLDSGFALLMVGVSSLQQHVVSWAKIAVSTANVVFGPLTGILMAIFGMCLFLISSYASHYFAKRPYLWTATAVGCALAVREVVVVLLGFKSGSQMRSLARVAYGSLAGMLAAEVVASLGILFVCMVGAWLGRRYHDEFLAKKLAHMEGKAAREAAKQHQSTPQSQTTATQASAQDSSAPQNSAPKLVTLVSRPDVLPSAPDGHRTSDPIKQIEKLARLRDAGALTEEEFQAKKTEILCRI